MDKLSTCIISMLFIMPVLSVTAEELTQDKPEGKAETKRSIVYSVKAISARTKLTGEMFREEWVPQAKIPQGAAARIGDLVGRIAQFDIPKESIVFTHFASGLHVPKWGFEDYKDPIPCIYDTSTNTWSIKDTRKPNMQVKGSKRKKR